MRLLFLPALLGVAVLAGVLVASLARAPGGPGPDGGVTPDSAGATHRHAAAGGTTAVRTTVAVRPYRVAGATAEAVLASLRAGGPHVDGGLFFGLTTTEVSYRFTYSETAGACETIDARVDLSVAMTLPEWHPPPEAPYDLRRDWHRFAAALRRHEEGHRDLAIENAHRLQHAVVGVRGTTCPLAAVLAGRQAERLQIEAEALHRRYDEATGHGETEGAVWPPQG